MVIIPIDNDTLPLIAAINGGVPPLVEEGRHTSFIYHDEDTKNEIVDTILVGLMLATGDYKIVETRCIVRE